MSENHRVKAALNSAMGFITLRNDVVALLCEGLSCSMDSCEIEGHDATAESIILLFADLLNDAPKALGEESGE